MKNLNYIINGILGAAVIVLFVLHFSEDSASDADHTNSNTAAATMGPSDIRIAYFEIDSVLENWNLYFSVQEELAANQKQLEADFENKMKGYVDRVEDAQYKMQRGLVTRAEAEQLQQQLAAEEQNLGNLQNSYAMQLQEEGMVKNRQMIDKIEQYLKIYNADKGYSYIFSYAFGGNLLYGNEGFNITSDVIEGINKEYPIEE